MVTNYYNGRFSIRSVVKTGYRFNVIGFFTDGSGYGFTGMQIALNDVVFIRGFDGKCYRLLVESIVAKSATRLELILLDDTETLITSFPSQLAALVRETPNRDYPQIPNGITEALRCAILNWYAVLADRITEGGCLSISQLTQTQLTGSETICLTLANGQKAPVSLNTLREWILTLPTPNGSDKWRLGIDDWGNGDNRQV